jgi:hypothetical protein
MVKSRMKRCAHPNPEMLRVVAPVLREMLLLKVLAVNDVTDVAPFLALHTFLFFPACVARQSAIKARRRLLRPIWIRFTRAGANGLNRVRRWK